MEKPKKKEILKSDDSVWVRNSIALSYYNKAIDEMDTYLAQKDKEISELVEALEDMIDIVKELRNQGLALGSEYVTKFDMAESALNKHKIINE